MITSFTMYFFLKQISHIFLIDIKYEIHSRYLINCFQGKFLARKTNLEFTEDQNNMNYEEYEDTQGVDRIRKYKTDKQHNEQN